MHTSTIFVSVALLLSSGLNACQQQSLPTPGSSAPSTPVTKKPTLLGAGATFPYPIYQRWFTEYRRVDPSVQINYQPVGSGAGVRQFLDQTVDFGATDVPLSANERNQAPQERGQPLQIPVVGGAVVLPYNLSGVKDLRLTRKAYCGIFAGKITRWNDAVLAAENPNVTLPDLPIMFANRSDGSGTTFIFSNHLKTVCPDWTLPASKFVRWPVGVSFKGNEGITATIQRTEGAIGYVELAYATANKLTISHLQNKAGQYVDPTPQAIADALKTDTIPEDLVVLEPDPESADAYPIVGLTWMLLYERYPNAEQGQTLKALAKWALSEGQQYAADLGYTPLDPEMAKRAIALAERIQAQP
jgi:phosphate transport system substrate-binding protein